MTVDIYFETAFNDAEIQSSGFESEKIQAEKQDAELVGQKKETVAVASENTAEFLPILSSQYQKYTPKRLMDDAFKQQSALNALLICQARSGAEAARQANAQQLTELLNSQAKAFSSIALLLQSADKRMKFALGQRKKQKGRSAESTPNDSHGTLTVTVWGKLVYDDATAAANKKITFLGEEKTSVFTDLSGRYRFENLKTKNGGFGLFVSSKKDSVTHTIENVSRASYQINLILP